MLDQFREAAEQVVQALFFRALCQQPLLKMEVERKRVSNVKTRLRERGVQRLRLACSNQGGEPASKVLDLFYLFAINRAPRGVVEIFHASL